MGSKGVKAIVVDAGGAERPVSQDADAFKDASRRFTQILREHAGGFAEQCECFADAQAQENEW